MKHFKWLAVLILLSALLIGADVHRDFADPCADNPDECEDTSSSPCAFTTIMQGS